MRPFEVEGQEDLDAAVLALLVDAVDVADELGALDRSGTSCRGRRSSRRGP